MIDVANDVSLVLSGGGVHAAYQVGFLRCLADHCPGIRIPILTGISAGAINAAFLAAHPGTFSEAVASLSEFWRNLSIDQVYDADAGGFAKRGLQWGFQFLTGGLSAAEPPKSIVDAAPLRNLLERGFAAAGGVIPGIGENIRRQHLKALAITATNYTTGQAVTWVQGRNIEMWERPHRHSVMTEITVDQVMASTALPLFFPAVRVGDSWYGDGGIRQYAPLSPSLHLGAKCIIAVSTRHKPTPAEADRPVNRGYPSVAQILDVLMNAIFVDLLDQDLLGLERVNRLLENRPPDPSSRVRLVKAFTLRPSVDLARVAGRYEPLLPRPFRFLTRRLGTSRTGSYEWLSMILFDPAYIRTVMEIGEADAHARKAELEEFLA